MTARLVFATLVFIVAMAPLIEGQMLADVARAEAERRAKVTPGRRYADADLRYVPPPAVAPPLAPVPDGNAAVAVAPVTDQAMVPVPGREKRDETYWKTRSHELAARVQDGRDRVATAEGALAQLDAAAASPARIREREVTATALVKLRRDLQFEVDELNRFEARARTDHIAQGWLR